MQARLSSTVVNCKHVSGSIRTRDLVKDNIRLVIRKHVIGKIETRDWPYINMCLVKWKHVIGHT